MSRESDVLRLTLIALVVLVLAPAAVITAVSGLPLALLQVVLGLEVTVP
jgi:hypothetical protein